MCTAQYRVDGLGARIVLLPARCVPGEHVLAASGYTATLTAEGVLCVACSACTTSDVDGRWLLATTGEASRAEFSATAYPNTTSTR
ncbi:hypothetical protein [Allokutzneria albata]|nr:hypothetical protein [Allokutzneria albata]